jgi:DNA polymerase (family 10)
MNPGAATKSTISNQEIAQRLEKIADLLEAQEANPYRVRAYRTAAETVRSEKRPMAEILEREGVEGLRRLPGIGVSLANLIEQVVQTGKMNLLEQLQGMTAPERVLMTAPGVGPVLAERIHEQLGIETLADLLDAAYDGRLDHVPGFGRQRVRAIRESLTGRLRRPAAQQRARPRTPSDQPPVQELLDVDREYRQKAEQKRLPTIAPRRFNPTGAAWLPILHTSRGETNYTALFSNTARAHELGATNDWVVIYRDDHDGSGQWTVVTARFGDLKGKRVVRGREAESTEFYAAPSTT